MRILLFILTVVLCSCGQGNNSQSNPDNKKNNVLDFMSEEMYTALVNYQKQYPLPKEKNDGDINLYEAFFYTKDQDTFLLIKRTGAGSQVGNDQVLMGVFKDSQLLPTVIIDSKNNYSKNFITRNYIDSTSLNAVKPERGRDYSETFPPTCNFKVISHRLSLISCDTVWYNWKK
jgi:hypothetical protein